MIAASYKNNAHVMDVLLGHGADVDGRNKVWFLWKVSSSRSSYVAFHLQHEDTPLIGASFFGQPKAVEFLLAHGADVFAVNSVSRQRLNSLV